MKLGMKAKKLIATALLATLVLGMTGCGTEEITLSIWTTETKVDLMEKIMKEFCDLHSGEVEINYHISKENEDTCKQTILGNPEGAADIFAFADDQIDELKDACALHAMCVDPAEALKPFGGKDSTAYESVVRDGKMYAYPETANGYFLYYNKAVVSDEDAKTLDGILRAVSKKDKKFTMDLKSGWYLYSFFKGAGLELKLDESGQKNICNWNATDTPHTGLEVAEAIQQITSNNAFRSLMDDEFLQGVKDGSIAAGVNGAWNAEIIKTAWGDDYAAVKLPTYTLEDEQVQMMSFTGYKVLGINAHSRSTDWCEKIVQFITSKDNQIREFEATGEVPANHEVVDSEQVKKAPAVMALNEQATYATLQRVGANFWDASSKFGVVVSIGNAKGDELQSLLDEMVKGITA